MSQFSKITSEDLAYFASFLPGRVFFGEDLSTDYSHDEMTEYGFYAPEVLLKAQTAGEIQQILRYCNERSIPVTPRGSGTGLCGGCVPLHGGVVLSTELMKKVLEVDRENMTATLEPGVLLMEFPQSLEGTGLFYPPDPGEKTATIGGNAMTNAGGMRAVRYGVTRDYILGMKVVLADGTLLELGGKDVKTSSGYSLLNLFIGSEGTLGYLCELTVKLVPEEKTNLTLLIPFPSLESCIGAVPGVLSCGCNPTAVEFMEREVITCAEEYLGKSFPDSSADAYLLVRLDGHNEKALNPAVELLCDTVLSLGALDVLLADTDERKESIWSARGAFLEAIKGSTPTMDECDVVVPRAQIPAFVRRSVEIGKECHIRVASFGHAGDGNLHIYICSDTLSQEEWKSASHKAMDLLYEASRELGGAVSGEHGIGHAKKVYLKEALGERQMELMRSIKAAFDPKGILNPGKII